MATTTTNYSFTKPAKSEYYDITVYNDTLDDIDTYLKLSEEQYEGAVAAASEAATSAANAEVSEATAVDAANSASGYADDAADSATLAESWAIGGTDTRDGEDTNNSMYYAGLASDYADDASDSATSASSYASKASTYATAAASSATSAASSATSAASSATAAASSADDAADSATEADEYAILAQSYSSGGTGTRDGEDTDNAYYWYTQAHEIAVEELSAETVSYTESTDSETTVQAIIDELIERIDNLEYMLIQNDISAPITDTSEDDDTIMATGDSEAMLANWSYATTTDVSNLESEVESTISEVTATITEVENTISEVESTIQSITFDDDEPSEANVNDIWISDAE